MPKPYRSSRSRRRCNKRLHRVSNIRRFHRKPTVGSQSKLQKPPTPQLRTIPYGGWDLRFYEWESVLPFIWHVEEGKLFSRINWELRFGTMPRDSLLIR
jgi:hypothetical protein